MSQTATIVIVSYHTGPALNACLAAALALPEAAEILLVDNGNPPEIVAALRQLAASQPRLQVVTGHGNIGFARGVNLGARMATAEWLWILNPDSIPAPDALSRLLAHQTALQETAPQPAPPVLIGARILNTDGSEQRGGRRAILTPWLALVEAIRLHRLVPGIDRFNWHEHPLPATALSPSPGITGAAMFMPRAAFLSLGGLDEAYFLHVEDMDFCLRWQRAGYKAYYAADVVLPHVGGTSAVPSLFVHRHKADSFARYFRTHFPRSRWLAVPLVWLRYCLIVLKTKLTGWGARHGR